MTGIGFDEVSENTAMRLSPDQVQAIRHTALRVLGAGARVNVFEIAKRTGVPP